MRGIYLLHEDYLMAIRMDAEEKWFNVEEEENACIGNTGEQDF